MPFDNVPERPPVPLEIAILTRAKELLLTEGWIQHSLHTKHGYCFSGAIWYAAGGMKAQNSLAFNRVRSIINKLVRPKPSFFDWLFSTNNIINWNDIPGRTLDEVVTVVDSAIEIARRDRPFR